mmetsp:Transcript_19264/g.57902  ORF Transcript_19264/g.57902 Transcript_19264/m.57902 type:complete len:205 (-) Transcript_19264:19-633(-)
MGPPPCSWRLCMDTRTWCVCSARRGPTRIGRDQMGPPPCSWHPCTDIRRWRVCSARRGCGATRRRRSAAWPWMVYLSVDTWTRCSVLCSPSARTKPCGTASWPGTSRPRAGISSWHGGSARWGPARTNTNANTSTNTNTTNSTNTTNNKSSTKNGTATLKAASEGSPRLPVDGASALAVVFVVFFGNRCLVGLFDPPGPYQNLP